MENTDPGEVFTIATFCKSYSISRPFYYKLQREGRAPRIIKLGRRVLISKEAARAWLADMEGTTA